MIMGACSSISRESCAEGLLSSEQDVGLFEDITRNLRQSTSRGYMHTPLSREGDRRKCRGTLGLVYAVRISLQGHD